MLYGMGYTLAEEEGSSDMMEEDRGSDKSSPDIHRHRSIPGWEASHPMYSSGAPLLPAKTPPNAQYAAMLAGIGLNLTAVRTIHMPA